GGLGISVSSLFAFASQLVCVGQLGKCGTALGQCNCFLQRRNGNIVLVIVSIKGRDRSEYVWIFRSAALRAIQILLRLLKLIEPLVGPRDKQFGSRRRLQSFRALQKLWGWACVRAKRELS